MLLSLSLGIIILFYLFFFSYGLFKTGSVKEALAGNSEISCATLLTGSNVSKSVTCSLNTKHNVSFLNMKVIHDQENFFAIQTNPITNNQINIICKNSQTCEDNLSNSAAPYFVRSSADLQSVKYSLNQYLEETVTIPTQTEFLDSYGISAIDQLCHLKPHIQPQVISNNDTYYVVGTQLENDTCKLINQTLSSYNSKNASIKFVYIPKDLK